MCADRSNLLINRNVYYSLFADDTGLSLMRNDQFPLRPMKIRTRMKWLFRSRSITGRIREVIRFTKLGATPRYAPAWEIRRVSSMMRELNLPSADVIEIIYRFAPILLEDSQSDELNMPRLQV